MVSEGKVIKEQIGLRTAELRLAQGMLRVLNVALRTNNLSEKNKEISQAIFLLKQLIPDIE